MTLLDKSNIIYEEGKFTDWLDKLKPMFEDHWSELRMNGGPETMNLDISRFYFYEKTHQLICMGARVGDEPIAYIANVVTYHPYHLGCKFASSLCFFVKPEYRTGRVGYKLIKFSEKVLKEKYNVKYFQVGTNANLDLEKFCTRLGFQKSDVIFTKPL